MSVLTAFDLFGTFVFAVSGAFRAVKYELDFLGVVVLAVATGVGGGIIRDILIGAVPPAALRDQRYLAVCLFGGVAVIVGASRIASRWDWVMLADGVGLGVFAAIGAAKAANHDLAAAGVLIMAALTATGGGVIRDLLVREIPAVLHADFYATAAILGGACLLVARSCGAPQPLQIAVAAVAAAGSRFLAMRYHIGLPHVHRLPASPSHLARRR